MRARHRWDPRCGPPPPLVTPVPRDPSGRHGPTPAQARGPYWRRTAHGLFVPRHVDGTVPEQRVAEAAALLGAVGAVTGWAALRLHGGNFFDGVDRDGRTPLPVPLCLGASSAHRTRSGVLLRRDRLDPDEIRFVHGIPVTAPERATFDAVRLARDVREAVVALDMAAAAEITSVERVRSYVDRRAGWKGVRRARRAIALADEASRSPNESRLRLIWQLDARFPRPLVNQPIWDRRGRLLGYADLLDPAAGVVGEYDGAEHRTALRHSADVDRESRMRDCGLELFRVTGPDLRDPDRVVDRMRAARARARWLPAPRRAWTMTAPEGEEAELSLDQVLVQREMVREAEERWQAETRVDPPRSA